MRTKRIRRTDPKAMIDRIQDFLSGLLDKLAATAERPAGGTNPAAQLLPLGPDDGLTQDQMFEGVHVFGATGSGKTTGSGQAIAVRLLKAGFGGLVLTAKNDELDTWKKYLKAAGRPDDDLCVLEPGGRYSFNFLEYEREVAEQLLAKRGSSQRMLTDNLVALFCAVMEVSQRGSGQGGQDAYWLQTHRQLLRNAIDLLALAGEEISIQNLYDLITSGPTHISYVVNKEDPICEGWRNDSYCWKCGEKAARAMVHATNNAPEKHPDHSVLNLTTKYWFREFPCLAEETRSVIVSYFTSVADGFLRGILRELFSSESDDASLQLTPESTHNGKVVVLNIPVKEFNELGQFAQVLYKFVWQRATERRNLKSPGQVPVFLWADEAQFFINSHDMLFQTTARSKRAATIYLTQNISNYYAVLPGEKGRAETDSLLGNFQTKIFHANGDSVTNKWAAELIGQDWTSRENTSTTISSRDDANGSSQFGSTMNQTLTYQVLPKRFTTLRKGGVDHDFKVEAFVFQGGRRWSNGQNFKGVVFTQEFLTEDRESKTNTNPV